MNKLDFPLFDHGWTADEELLMFEGLEKLLFDYVGMGLEIGEKLLILSAPTKRERLFRNTIMRSIWKAKIFCR